jgi:multicomponent K+:H+ antiporter subunit E
VSRLIPHPVLSLLLLLMWLLLTRFSTGHLVLGSMIGLAAGWALSGLHPQAPRLRRWDLIAKLMAIVSYDIIRSNIAVAWLILAGGRNRQRRSEFIEIPLDLRSQGALALLAIILTATPGTAWLEYKPSTGMLLLHVFDMVDEATWRDLIKNRYEALLLEILE